MIGVNSWDEMSEQLWNLKVTSIYKTQKILQLKDTYSLEAGKFKYKYDKTHKYRIHLTINYFKLITDVHSYITMQTKTK